MVGTTHTVLLLIASDEEIDKKEKKHSQKRDKNKTDNNLKASFDCHLLSKRKFPPDIQSINLPPSRLRMKRKPV